MEVFKVSEFTKKNTFRLRKTLILVDNKAENTASIDEWNCLSEQFDSDLINPGTEKQLPSKNYEIIIIHHSINPMNFYYLPFHWLNYLKNFNGLKVMFSQDEYRRIDLKCELIKNLNIHILFSTLSTKNIKIVYKNLNKKKNFYIYKYYPGFFRSKNFNFKVPRISERKKHIIYRGKPFGSEMGNISRKKELIGKLINRKFKNTLNLDISSNLEKRVYTEWLKFNCEGKSTLCTYGGSEIYDFDENIINKINFLRKKGLKENAIYKLIKKEEVKKKNLLNHTVITQRVFDAIKTKTPIIAFENQSKFFKDNKLKAIFIKKKNNYGEIFKKLNDDKYLQNIADYNYKLLKKEKKFHLEYLCKKYQSIIEHHYKKYIKKRSFEKLEKKKVLIFYDKRQTYTPTVADYLLSFKKYSNNEIYYKHLDEEQEISTDLNNFDVLVIHYSYRICFENLPKRFIELFSKFKKQKIIFLQDEYENKKILDQNLNILKPQIIFTVVPNQNIEKIYPKVKFPNIKFQECLTGYLSETLIESRNYIEYLNSEKRKSEIFYRARKLNIIYGSLGLLKYKIGEKTKKYVSSNEIGIVDIETDESKRIYGKTWFEKLSKSKVMLGSESGSNIFDFAGNLKKIVEKEKSKNVKDLVIYEKYLAQHDRDGLMNQISPKIFEAIQSGCCLLLVEGNYSGILKKNKNYLSVKKDFSNLEEMINKSLEFNIERLEIVERNYYTIALNDKYSYKNLISKFDKLIKKSKSKQKKFNDFNYKYNQISDKPLILNVNSIDIISIIMKIILIFYSKIHFLIPKKIKKILKKIYYRTF